MVNNKTIMVRVTENQRERIINNASAKGFKTISSYMRSLALEHDLSFERKFNEVYNLLIEDNKPKENRNTLVKS